LRRGGKEWYREEMFGMRFLGSDAIIACAVRDRFRHPPRVSLGKSPIKIGLQLHSAPISFGNVVHDPDHDGFRLSSPAATTTPGGKRPDSRAQAATRTITSRLALCQLGCITIAALQRPCSGHLAVTRLSVLSKSSCERSWVWVVLQQYRKPPTFFYQSLWGLGMAFRKACE
jgi:hypothetical protein